MINQISTHEMENLSAYLDEELPSRERQSLEARLAKNADLRSELEDLRRLRSVLRAQPGVRAPRNFTLTPAMAGVRQGARPLPTVFSSLRLASALATIFFVLVFAGDLIGRALQPEPRLVQVSNQQPPAVPFGMGGGGGGGGMAPVPPPMAQELAVEKSMATPADTLEAESAIANLAPTETAQADMSASGPMSVLPEGSPMPSGAEPVVPAAAPQEPPSEALLAPGVAGGVEAPADLGGQSTPVEVVRPQTVWSWSLLRILQVLLAVLAVVTGLAAYLVRRSARD